MGHGPALSSTSMALCCGASALLVILHAEAAVWPAAAQDARMQAYGRHLAQECTSCHRLDGADDGIPPIIGWEAGAFAATMKLYQTGARTNPVMVSVAKSLNDAQIDALAAYLGSLPKRERKSHSGK